MLHLNKGKQYIHVFQSRKQSNLSKGIVIISDGMWKFCLRHSEGAFCDFTGMCPDHIKINLLGPGTGAGNGGAGS